MDKVKIYPQMYIWAAILLFLLPLRWLLAAIFAAIVHESAHLLVLKLLKCKVTEIRIGVLGAAIRTGPLTNWEELVCALAGPAGSFLVILFYRVFPEAALCAFVQGLFNLLPVYPLDGGRALRNGIGLISKRPEKALKWVEPAILICIAAISGAICLIYRIGLFLPAVFLIMAGNALLRKISCKPGKLALQ